MRKRTLKRKNGGFPLLGLCVTAGTLLLLLCVTAALMRGQIVPESRTELLLAPACLLSATAGCLSCRGQGGGKLLAQLLSGAVPASALLCTGVILGGGAGVGKALLWNAGALLLPCLAAQLPGGRKTKRRK